MKHLFGPEGSLALRELSRARPLLAFDFDGTLAPIVARPDDARVPTAIATRLARLAQQRPVAIITGRAVADVRPRLGFEPHFVVGNHGAEREGDVPASGTALDALRQHLLAQAPALTAAQVQLEDKVWSLALHYRLAYDREAAQACIDALLGDLDPRLARFGGKCVVNIVPADAADKGDAVVSLLAETGANALLFVGDDLNDEAVFTRAGPGWLTVRIGRDDPRSKARFFLDSHAEMATLLETLLQQESLP